jgi:hypothetical protein
MTSVRLEIEKSQQEQWDDLRSLMAAYAGRRPVRSVAVVGNAPLPPDRSRASRIDSCDLVIRANSLVLDEPGAEPCVGTACHVVLISRSTRFTKWVFQDYRSRLYLIMQAGFTNFRTIRPTAEHWPSDLGALPVPNTVVTRRLADLLDADRPPASLIPTTGTTGLFLAHEMFPESTLFATGFSFVANRRQSEWAHHAGGVTRVNEKHDLEREGDLLQAWIEDGSVFFLD